MENSESRTTHITSALGKITVREALPKRVGMAVGMGLLVLAGLYVVSLRDYLLFHALAELFSIVVAVGIFLIVWNARRFVDNGALLFLGIAYLFVAGLDLFHTLAYKGMGVFPGAETNTAAQLWIAARYLQGLSLLVAPFLLGRALKVRFVVLGGAVVFALVMASIFYWRNFPTCFVEQEGLTPFKKVSEYVICLILVGAILGLLRQRGRFDPAVLYLLIGSVAVTIASELAFTLYTDPYGLPNKIGHFLKIVSFYLIYKALIQSALVRPYSVMFRELKLNEEALRSSEERFRRTFDEAPIGAAMVSLNHRFQRINDALCRFTGYTEKELTAMAFTDIMHPEDREASLEHARRLIAGETDRYEADGRYIRKDGAILWARLSLRLLCDAEDRPLYFLPMIEDITDRKEAERELHEAVAKLERSNTELEQFAHIASHDLQSPLVVVGGYLGLLARRYKDRLDAEGLSFIASAQEGVAQMQQLIHDILTYSRLDAAARPAEQTACSGVMEIVLANLQGRIEETGARVTCDEMPTVTGDNRQLVQLLQNLIENGIKFRADRPPEIHVGAEPKDGQWLFSVRDNGIGIPPEGRERIFRMFERLHGRSEYPGTGIGLALCKKIVERHGGRIWVDSEPGKGSTFYFTMPMGQE